MSNRKKVITTPVEDLVLSTNAPLLSERLSSASARRSANGNGHAKTKSPPAANGMIAAGMETMIGPRLAIDRSNVERLRTLALLAADVAWSDACRLVAKRRELNGDGATVAVKQAIQRMTCANDMLGIIAELLAARISFGWGKGFGDEHDKGFWQAWGINRPQLVKQFRGAGKEKEKKAAATKVEKTADKREAAEIRKAGKRLLAGKRGAHA